mmetsp:Transcript_42916/g.113105  ORF Transcript_42916/g.113105 Transcript_42916/m.113105 type:complete len:204 (+) Transcript_42916:294-905(+)
MRTLASRTSSRRTPTCSSRSSSLRSMGSEQRAGRPSTPTTFAAERVALAVPPQLTESMPRPWPTLGGWPASRDHRRPRIIWPFAGTWGVGCRRTPWSGPFPYLGEVDPRLRAGTSQALRSSSRVCRRGGGRRTSGALIGLRNTWGRSASWSSGRAPCSQRLRICGIRRSGRPPLAITWTTSRPLTRRTRTAPRRMRPCAPGCT